MSPEQNTLEQQKTDNPTAREGKVAATGRWQGSKMSDQPPTHESAKEAKGGRVETADNKKGGAHYSPDRGSQEGPPFSSRQFIAWTATIVALVWLIPTIVNL